MAVLESVNGYYLWNYVPSLAGAVIFAVLFAGASAIHLWRLLRTRTVFCWPFVVGCIFDCIGYGARISSVSNTGKLPPYIIQTIFLIISPALFAASIYMTLGRIMRCVKGEHLSVIRITWVTRAFVIGDILSFWVQGASSSLITKSDTVKIGEYMVIGGLAIQIISFGLFFLTAIIFQIRIAKQPTQASYHVKAPWKQTLYMLYAVSILILIRSAFRVIEFIQGQDGYALRHEWTLYVFDSVPMILVTMLFYFRYPSKIMPQTAGCDELSETQMTETISSV